MKAQGADGTAAVDGQVGRGRRNAKPARPPDHILSCVLRNAEADPGGCAYRMVAADGGVEEWSFLELAQRVECRAEAIAAAVPVGERALVLHDSPGEFLQSFLACLAAGVVPALAPPPRKPRHLERLQILIADCQAAAVIADPTVRDWIAGQLNGDATDVSFMVPRAYESSGVANLTRLSGWVNRLRGTDLAFLQYTSGSTSIPRGVMVSHRNLTTNLEAIQIAYRLSHQSVSVSWLPLFHDLGLIGGALVGTYTRFPVALISPESFIAHPALWLQTITDYGGTLSGAPNFAYDYCTHRVSEAEKATLDLSSWFTAFVAAEPVRPDTLRRFATSFGTCGFRMSTLFPSYGLAETTLVVSGGPPSRNPRVLHVEANALERHEVRIVPASMPGRDVVSCGMVVAGASLLIRDLETGAACSDGRIGEIEVRAPFVTGGYWGQPEATAAAFSFPAGEHPMVRTGDLGFVLDGELFVTGRCKDVIIVRGRNIYPYDIESIVRARTDSIVAAVGVPDERDGEAVAIVAESDLGSESGERLISELRAEIVEAFEVRIHSITLVPPGAIPRTTSGKLRRREIRDAILARTSAIDAIARPPGAADAVEPTASVAPASEDVSNDDVMVRVVRFLNERLASAPNGTPPTVDTRATFASLGVDSLAAAEIVAFVETEFGVSIEPEALYDHPTVAELAEVIVRLRERAIRRHTRPQKSGSGAAASAAAIATAEGAPALARYVELNPARRWRASGTYHYETPFTRFVGSAAVTGDSATRMFASFSYLGLSNHPTVLAAAKQAIDTFGAGSHGVRLVAGTTTLHKQLEHELASFMLAEDAVVFPTGFGTNAATIQALVGAEGAVIGDELNHASIVDGCLLSGARFLQFRHNDLSGLERHLQRAAGGQALVVVDGVYSMDGDAAPLPEIHGLCRRYGALLMVDEAHSLGVLGNMGRGVQEHYQLPPDAIDVKMGTLSKALGGQGGFVAGAAPLIDFLRHRARGYVFSTALAPPLAAAALAGLGVLQTETWRVLHVQRNARRLVRGIREMGLRTTPTVSAIIPVMCETEEQTLAMTAECRQRGLYVAPIFYPAVPVDAPRLRLTVTAALSDADIDFGLDVLAKVARDTGLLAG